MTVAEFADNWMARFPRESSKTREDYEGGVQPFCVAFGDRALNDLDPLVVRSWAYRDETRPHHVRIARAMLGDAFKIGALTQNPLAGVSRSRGSGRKDLAIPSTEEIYALSTCASEIVGLEFMFAIRFGARTGLRQGEQFALRWSDVSLAEGIAYVRAETTKSRRGRTIVVSKAAEISLPVRTGGQVFASLDRHAVARRFTASRETAGLDPTFTWHGLRHFFATDALNRRVSVEDIALQLGHRDGGRLVADLYGHPDEIMARERLRRALDD